MLYSLIANTILLIHLGYVLFVVFGGFLLLRWSWLWKIHLPAVIWGFLVQYFVWVCPLTNWENYFRSLSGEVGYADGFINYFLTILLYPNIHPTIHTYIGIFLLILNLGIYFYVVKKK